MPGGPGRTMSVAPVPDGSTMTLVFGSPCPTWMKSRTIRSRPVRRLSFVLSSRVAASFACIAWLNAASVAPMMTAVIAMATSSSISVKPACVRCRLGF